MNKGKLLALVRKIETETKERYIKDGLAIEIHKRNLVVTINPGRKYTKIDIGGSGKLMITENGEIFGIKAYGVIHLGHHYGTLDTINDWFWGHYSPVKLSKERTV